MSVVIKRLDNFVEAIELPLAPEILIKLDEQGYEDRVIAGAKVTFSKARACISEINFDLLYEGQCSFRDVWSLLDGLGYRYAGNLDQTYAQDGHVLFADCLFVKP